MSSARVFPFSARRLFDAVGMELGDQEYSAKIVVRKASLLIAEGERKVQEMKSSSFPP